MIGLSSPNTEVGKPDHLGQRTRPEEE